MSFRDSASRVIKNRKKLSFDYVPDELPNRDEQMNELFGLYRGVLDSEISQNVFLHGPVGTGKTATAKRFCMDFKKWAKEKGQALDHVLVNCRRRNNNSAAMWKIVHHFDKGFPDRGFSVDEMMKTLDSKIKERNTHLIVVLDEADALIQKEGSELIYLLSRFDEEGVAPQGSVSLFLISQKNAFELLDESALSSFKRSNRIKFPKYNPEEMYPILEQRAEMALYPGAIQDSELSLLADISGRKGDARFGIELLEKAGLIAEMDGRDQIKPEDVRSAKAEVDPYMTERKLKKLNEQERLILLASTRKLKKQSYTQTGEIEETYNIICEEYEKKKLGHTQFWKYIKTLADEGLLDTKTISDGSGRTTKVSLADIPAEVLEEKLTEFIG